MGLREWASKGPVDSYGKLSERIFLYKDRIEQGKESHPLEGVTARVEKGDEVRRRVTATRLVAMGVFALAAKKKVGKDEYWLTIESPEMFWSIEVDAKDQKKARAFATAVNQQARQQ